MAYYIDREAIYNITHFLKDDMLRQVIERIIAYIPAADVVPVKHGEWLDDVAYYDEDGCPCIVTRCNQCGEANPVSNFCPNCGADMREDGEA